MPKEINFEGLVAEAYRQSAEHRGRGLTLLSEIQSGVAIGIDEELLEKFDRAKEALSKSLSIGTLVEYFAAESVEVAAYDEEQKQALDHFREQQALDREQYLGRKRAFLLSDAKEAGMSLSYEGLIIEERQLGRGNIESEEQAKKRKGIERIRRNLGNVEAFKTKEDPEGERLNLRALDVLGKHPGVSLKLVRRASGYPSKSATVADIVSRTEKQIKAAEGIGEKRFTLLLEALYAEGIIPDEKWDYVELVDKFVEDSGLEVSPEVRISLMNAALAAREFGANYIVSEHLFLGLITDELPLQVKDDDKSVRYWVAENYGVDPLSIETKLQAAYTRRTGEPQPFDASQMTFTENLLRVLRKADEIRVSRSSEKISPSDVMEALLSKKSGLLARVLTKLGPRKEIKQPSGYMFRNVTAG